MCQYSHYTYCLQEESTHFALRLSKLFGLKVSRQFDINHKQKISHIPKDLLSFSIKKLLNEIRQIIYSFYQAKEITRKVDNNIINSAQM